MYGILYNYKFYIIPTYRFTKRNLVLYRCMCESTRSAEVFMTENRDICQQAFTKVSVVFVAALLLESEVSYVHGHTTLQ